SDDTADPAARPKLTVLLGAVASSTPTTPTTATTSTTSTTLPGCQAAATFPSIVCGLSALATELERDAPPSALRSRLLAALQGHGLQNVQQAEQFMTDGDRARARIRLRHAARGLTTFMRLLNSQRGRKAVPQSRGGTMGDEARAVR